MKRTFTINIANIVFHIDSDAYEVLKEYLEKLELFYQNTEMGVEVVEDIENRIAELFVERSKGRDNIIDKASVHEVIGVLGTPEVIYAEEEGVKEEETKGEEKQTTFQTKRTRRLFRNPDNQVIAGVVSGLAAYFGIDVVVMRILYVLLFFLSLGTVATLIYLVIWCVVPKAVTNIQKMEMQGTTINISTIEVFVKESYENIKRKFD